MNELVKRVRLAKAHAHIVGHLKKEMPSMFGNKGKAQAKLLGGLEDHFLKAQPHPLLTPSTHALSSHPLLTPSAPALCSYPLLTPC